MSRSVRDLIKAKKIPPLPVSKMDTKEMCLVCHTKGVYNSGSCPQEVDHMENLAEEYALLCKWCKEHYPDG